MDSLVEVLKYYGKLWNLDGFIEICGKFYGFYKDVLEYVEILWMLNGCNPKNPCVFTASPRCVRDQALQLRVGLGLFSFFSLLSR